LNWIDCNGVYYDRYEADHYPNRQNLTGQVRDAIQKVFDRRCTNCHGADDGRHDTWWLSVSRHDVRQSGCWPPRWPPRPGLGPLRGGVFASTSDPDYQALLAALTGLADRLQRQPARTRLAEGDRRGASGGEAPCAPAAGARQARGLAQGLGLLKRPSVGVGPVGLVPHGRRPSPQERRISRATPCDSASAGSARASAPTPRPRSSTPWTASTSGSRPSRPAGRRRERRVPVFADDTKLFDSA